MPLGPLVATHSVRRVVRQGEREWIAPLLVVGVSYAMVRLLLVVHLAPTRTYDSAGYEAAISLTGSAFRPWLLPALYRVLPDTGVAMMQVLVSAAAFVTLSVAIGNTMRHQHVRVISMGAVLLLGLSPRITAWDTALLSESLAISLTCVLVALVVSRSRSAWWFTAVVVSFALWAFVRDAHGLLAPIAGAGLVAAGWNSRWRWWLSLSVVLTVLWVGIAAQRNNEIEAVNVTANIAFRIQPDTASWDWFRGRGMPDSTAFDIEALYARRDALWADPEFRGWIDRSGVRSYQIFLLTHPRFVLEGLERIFVARPPVEPALADAAHAYTDPRSIYVDQIVWPRSAAVMHMVALTAVAGVLVGVAAKSRRLDRRVMVPLFLVLTSIPHALLVYHGAPTELPRHALTMSFLLTLSLWWLVGIAVDQVLAPNETDAD